MASSLDDIAKLIKAMKPFKEIKAHINSDIVLQFDKDVNTVLDYAICYRDDEFIRDLITTYKLPLTFPSSMKHNPYIFHAYEHKKFDVLDVLLELGADPNEKDIGGIPLLVTAVTDGNMTVLNILLKYDKTNINVKTDESCNAAVYAAERNQIDALKLLIKHGINVNQKDSLNVTPLMHAAISNNYECAKLLIENGAKINEQDNDGLTALNYALLGIENKSSRTCLEYLLDKGAVKYIKYDDIKHHTTINEKK